ncbi:hypothetical protein IJ531_06775 [bacterium]|nr:hypothetical protein [bacterium]
MFICHNCGYKDFSDGKRANCPICAANVTVPKCVSTLFLSLVGFIIFSFLSMMNDKLNIIAIISLFAAILSAPFAIIEAQERKNKVKEGFIAPDYPGEVINGSARVPNFTSYDYVYGINDDEDIKKILLEAHSDGLNIYYNKLGAIQTIEYKYIKGLVLHEENDLGVSNSKSIIYAALLGITGGIGAGIAGAVIGGIENKTEYVLEIQFQEDNEAIRCLYITSDKHSLNKLIKNIEDMANGAQVL